MISGRSLKSPLKKKIVFEIVLLQTKIVEKLYQTKNSYYYFCFFITLAMNDINLTIRILPDLNLQNKYIVNIFYKVVENIIFKFL